MPHDFNRSIWNALWILIPLGAGVFAFVYRDLGGGSTYYFFDPKHNPDSRLQTAGDYEPHAKRYHDLAKLAITLSSAAVAFIVSLFSGERSPNIFFAKVEAVAPIVVGFFGFSIALLISFLMVQSIWYEEYCHSADHSTYKRWKYATSTSLGYTGLVAFVLGFLWLARNLFRG